VNAVKFLSFLFWWVLVTSALGQNGAGHADPQTLSRVEVHFRLYRNYLIVVQGNLGCLEGLNFLIDTGANPTAVDKKIANKLGLKGQSKKLELLDQSVGVETVELPTLRLGPIRAESIRGIVQDLSPVENNLGVRIDAIVGFGILSAENFTIDYDSKKIVFGEIEPLPFAVPFDTAPPTLTVPLRVRDQVVHLLLDSGAKDLLLFECTLPGHARDLATLSVNQVSSTKGKAFYVREVRLSQVHLGTTDLGSITALVVPGKQTCGWSFAGVMGMSAIGFRQIAFDFERNLFMFRK
jgi:predicted aspartyl protease